MGAVAHFFGEDLGRIDFTGNVPTTIVLSWTPFNNRVLTKINVTCRLRCHVVAPADTGIIVIVDESWLIYIKDLKAPLLKAKTEVA
jgi:hypothetical protein